MRIQKLNIISKLKPQDIGFLKMVSGSVMLAYLVVDMDNSGLWFCNVNWFSCGI
jgi:hypothetical protein